MKTLYVCRHAKSSWDNPSTTDHDRPLNDRGLRDAPRMAAHMAQWLATPDIVLSSTAVRAASTAVEYHKGFELGEQSLRYEPRLYDASLGELQSVVSGLDDTVTVAMIVAHNPGVTEVVRWYADAAFAHMPTGAVAVIHFAHAETWQETARGTGALTHFLFPKGITD